ncbi:MULTISPECIES: hypothetical protein [Bacillaceae]|uniref:Uncharacterized protein n=1 Tax=Metabacillus sediminis TaxID=3117746 RepID=A0ABZ2NC50_9BACI|nr:hypothetical protein [Bacillus sp. SJS]KZZ84281.1 hypothetical protein AS29_012035 [Bacillus sp. SJS]
MLLNDFMMDTDRKMISFSFSLLNEVNEKIQRKILFYENQVLSYVQKQIDTFIQSLNISITLQTICRSELSALIQSKLNRMLAQYSLFRSC